MSYHSFLCSLTRERDYCGVRKIQDDLNKVIFCNESTVQPARYVFESSRSQGT